MDKLKIVELQMPKMDFGSPGDFNNIKVGLSKAGPFDLRFGSLRKEKILIGIVGEKLMIDRSYNWIQRCQNEIIGDSKIIDSFDFTGFKNIFRTDLIIDNRAVREINSLHVTKILSDELQPVQKFKNILSLYDEALKGLSNSETRPDIIMCALSKDVVTKCWSVRKIPTKQEIAAINHMKAIEKTKQLFLFDELVEPVEEDLIFRDFRRALKAIAMKYKIPIQIVTDNLLIDSPTSQDPATKAWNFSVAFYYKAGGIPWRISIESPETCFVGISFHHLKTNYKHFVYSCIAQAFTTRGDGFAIKGDSIPFEGLNINNRILHLNFEQAFSLGKKILVKFREETGSVPQRIVLHKTSTYNEEEVQGLKQAFANIPLIEFISLRETPFRLLKQSDYPVKRGTLCILNNKNFYVYTTGYIPELKTYPGPHIPTPAQIISAEGDIDYTQSAQDILALTKMNWNSASNTNKQPITFMFSRKVGGIMGEFGDQENMPTSLRYFM